mmetsp:Transcript_4495/g.8666  ORF Transcript_4495/g.8666 Transcript_4495/m.8666 type:complete len:118 (-) Transcript_4495:47-400(-)
MAEESQEKHGSKGYEAELLSEENQKHWEEKRTQAVSHMDELERERQEKLRAEFVAQRELEDTIEELEHYQESKATTAELERQEQERRIHEADSEEVLKAKANLSAISAEIKAKGSQE